MPRRNNTHAGNLIANGARNLNANGVRNRNGNGGRIPKQGLLFVSHGADIIPNPALKRLPAFKNSEIRRKVTWKQIREKEDRIIALERVLQNERQLGEPTIDQEETRRLIEHERGVLKEMLTRAPKRKKTIAEVAYGMLPAVVNLLDKERRITDRQRIVLKTFLKRLREKKVTGKLVREVNGIIEAIKIIQERTRQA
jgi:hypothetical protein